MSQQEANIHVSYFKHLGRYNLMNNDKQWRVSFQSSFGNLSITWPEDDEPDIDGALPSEVLDVIEKRLGQFFYSSGEAEDRATIAKCREHAKELDMYWLSKRIERVENDLLELRERLEEVSER